MSFALTERHHISVINIAEHEFQHFQEKCVAVFHSDFETMASGQKSMKSISVHEGLSATSREGCEKNKWMERFHDSS